MSRPRPQQAPPRDDLDDFGSCKVQDEEPTPTVPIKDARRYSVVRGITCTLTLPNGTLKRDRFNVGAILFREHMSAELLDELLGGGFIVPFADA